MSLLFLRDGGFSSRKSLCSLIRSKLYWSLSVILQPSLSGKEEHLHWDGKHGVLHSAVQLDLALARIHSNFLLLWTADGNGGYK